MSDENKGIYLDRTVICLAVIITVLLCIVSFFCGRLSGLSRKGETVQSVTSEKAPAEKKAAPDTSGIINAPKVTAADRIPQDESAVKSGEEKELPTQAPANYEAVMNTRWEFDSGVRVSKNAYVENAKSNSNTVYFTVTSDEFPDSELFRSENLAPGDSLYKVELVSALPDGEYEGEVVYHVLDDAGNEVGRVNTGVQLVVGK